MKQKAVVLSAVFFVSACMTPEPIDDVGNRGAVSPHFSGRPKPSAPHAASEQPAPPEKPERATHHDALVKPDKVIEPEPDGRPARRVGVYSVPSEDIRGMSKAYRDLNVRRDAPDYLQTRPREQDPFYGTVNRTGSNPMNTPDRTTNRPANR